MYSTISTNLSVQSKAEAFITKGKNRLKQNGSEVYLNDKDNFEIELFNPRTSAVLVKVKINGKLISFTGLVLQPGQRYHLDRHIDEAAKFVFNTYEVESSKEAMQAISENGSVVIDFYDEVQVYNNVINNYNGIKYFTGNGSGDYQSSPSWTTSNSSYNSYNSTNSYNFQSILRGGSPTVTMDSASIETGRVGKGEESSQKFGVSNSNFSSFFL